MVIFLFLILFNASALRCLWSAALEVTCRGQVCNRPDADVPRVACLLNLQGFRAAAADLHAAFTE
jgi:hypothetical protein